LGKVSSVLAYLVFILGANSLMLAPIIGTVAAPKRSAKMIEVTLGWLERNNRVITAIISLIFGGWFLWRGMTGLVAHGQPAARAPSG
jgi:hypothetical protein